MRSFMIWFCLNIIWLTIHPPNLPKVTTLYMYSPYEFSIWASNNRSIKLSTHKISIFFRSDLWIRGCTYRFFQSVIIENEFVHWIIIFFSWAVLIKTLSSPRPVCPSPLTKNRKWRILIICLTPPGFSPIWILHVPICLRAKPPLLFVLFFSLGYGPELPKAVIITLITNGPCNFVIW